LEPIIRRSVPLLLSLQLVNDAPSSESGVTTGDEIVILIGVVTLFCVVLFFVVEQWPHWKPFQLLGCQVGKHPLPEDPQRVEPLSLNKDNNEFVLKIRPRVGGPCGEMSLMFLRPPTLRERFRQRTKLKPTVHWVSPDIVDVESLRVEIPTQGTTCTRSKTTGEKDLFLLNPKLELTPDEPILCIVNARIHQQWKGEFSIRPKITGVTRGRIAVRVEAAP
jgi:hypothetical protein